MNTKEPNEDNKNQDHEASTDKSDIERRNLLKVGATLAAILAVGGIGAVGKSLVNPSSGSSAKLSFPKIKVASLSDLKAGVPLFFNYPLEETPNLLVKLSTKTLQGVGPDGDIVAYSTVCQHLGCIWGFVEGNSSPSCNSKVRTSGPVGYCCCHGSEYDLTSGGKVLGGPAPRPQPQVRLLYDDTDGSIYATGMFPPSIFGHSTGSQDVNNDLQGGTLVTS